MAKARFLRHEFFLLEAKQSMHTLHIIVHKSTFVDLWDLNLSLQ